MAPWDHKRNPKRRGQYKDEKKRKWIAVPRKVSLIYTNKKIFAEAAPILYGGNRFEFDSVATLDRFFWQISEDMKRCLRSIAILSHSGGPAGLKERWCDIHTKRTYAQLASAINLRSVELSHFYFCSESSKFIRHCRERLARLVKFLSPLLYTLQLSAHLEDCKSIVLDAIKVVIVSKCNGCDCKYDGQHATERHVKIDGERPENRGYVECACQDDEVDAVYDGMNAVLKHIVVEKSGNF